MQGLVQQPQRTRLQAASNRPAPARTLRGASSWQNDLSEQWLTGARLAGEDLREACFRNTDLTDADLRGADLRGADLRGADLSLADLRGADLRETRLNGARLRGARCSEQTRWPAGFRPEAHPELNCEMPLRPRRDEGRRDRHTAFCTVAGLALAADQIVKLLVRDYLPQGGAPRWLPGDAVFLQRVENHGLNLQLLDGQGPILTVVMGLVLAAVLAMWMSLARRGPVAPHRLAGLALVFGGGLANTLDRAVFGAVLDYIGIYGGPVINLADLAVAAGLICLFIHRPESAGRPAAEPLHIRRPVHSGMGV